MNVHVLRENPMLKLTKPLHMGVFHRWLDIIGTTRAKEDLVNTEHVSFKKTATSKQESVT